MKILLCADLYGITSSKHTALRRFTIGGCSLAICCLIACQDFPVSCRCFVVLYVLFGILRHALDADHTVNLVLNPCHMWNLDSGLVLYAHEQTEGEPLTCHSVFHEPPPMPSHDVRWSYVEHRHRTNSASMLAQQSNICLG